MNKFIRFRFWLAEKILGKLSYAQNFAFEKEGWFRSTNYGYMNNVSTDNHDRITTYYRRFTPFQTWCAPDPQPTKSDYLNPDNGGIQNLKVTEYEGEPGAERTFHS